MMHMCIRSPSLCMVCILAVCHRTDHHPALAVIRQVFKQGDFAHTRVFLVLHDAQASAIRRRLLPLEAD